jgi:DNA primase
MRMWALLAAAGVIANARAAGLPAGADPAETLTSRGREALVHALTAASTPLVDAVVAAMIEDHADNDIAAADIPARVAALHRAAPFVAQTGRPEDVVRLVAYLADRLQLAHSAVTIAVTDAITASTAVIDAPKTARLSTGTHPVHRNPRPACPGRPHTMR